MEIALRQRRQRAPRGAARVSTARAHHMRAGRPPWRLRAAPLATAYARKERRLSAAYV